MDTHKVSQKQEQQVPHNLVFWLSLELKDSIPLQNWLPNFLRINWFIPVKPLGQTWNLNIWKKKKKWKVSTTSMLHGSSSGSKQITYDLRVSKKHTKIISIYNYPMQINNQTHYQTLLSFSHHPMYRSLWNQDKATYGLKTHIWSKSAEPVINIIFVWRPVINIKLNIMVWNNESESNWCLSIGTRRLTIFSFPKFSNKSGKKKILPGKCIFFRTLAQLHYMGLTWLTSIDSS